MSLRCGVVALVGWTNVGKSTLLNHLAGEKIAAIADVPQTTRHRIRGVCNRPGRGQIVLVDTPGLHRPRHRMNRTMIEQALETVRGVDLALHIVDAERGLGDGDRDTATRLDRIGVPRVLVLNKLDRVRPKHKLLPMMQSANELGYGDVVPISALNGEGCDELVDCVLTHLPESEPLFPEDYLTDQTERHLAAEWIREKLLRLTRQELPHATAVLVEEWNESEARVDILATILVERESQKPIVIGRGGELLKQVGTEARGELERLLGKQVVLKMWVKIRKDWRDDPRVLRALGLE